MFGKLVRHLAHLSPCATPQSGLWFHYIRYPFDDLTNDLLTNWSSAQFFRQKGPLLPIPKELSSAMEKAVPGRLCCACTGEGKRRIFAIGNYVNQRLLYPYHQWLVAVLRRLRTDGTFDQPAPLHRLRGLSGTVYSIDLKAATDGWPIILLTYLTQKIFGIGFTGSAVYSALYRNYFEVAFTTRRHLVSFNTGQPLGYYSSWPLFALSHHLVMWYAAEQVYPGRVFTRYAILGDDYVVVDDAVRNVYSSVIARLGVGISVGKSLTSPTGAVEFAKRFRLNKLSTDVSPLSVRKICQSNTPLGW